LFLALLQNTGSLGIGSHHLHQLHLDGGQIFTYMDQAGTIGARTIGMSGRGMFWRRFHARKNADQKNDNRKSQDKKTHNQPFRIWVSPAKVLFFRHLVSSYSPALFGFGNRLSGPARYLVK
jgi:hypothetical protein